MPDYWIKLYIEMVDDPKVATLPDRLWRRVVELFLLAGKFHQNGELPDTRQLAWTLRMSTDELEMDLKQIEATGIIGRTVNGWKVIKFAQRQAPVADAERKRQSRLRQHHEQYDGNVTNPSRIVTQINRLTDTDTETEEGKSATFASDLQSLNVFTTVTGMLAFPGSLDEQEAAIHKIRALMAGKNVNQTSDYLKPFYEAWRKRGYRSFNLSWLDWSIAGEIPPDPKAKSNGNRVLVGPDGRPLA